MNDGRLLLNMLLLLLLGLVSCSVISLSPGAAIRVRRLLLYPCSAIHPPLTFSVVLEI